MSKVDDIFDSLIAEGKIERRFLLGCSTVEVGIVEQHLNWNLTDAYR